MGSRDLHPADFLATWYSSRCDGDWEHQYGVRIETLDNPGWALDVDLTGSPFETAVRPRSIVEHSEVDWIAVDIGGGVFRARGGPMNLVDLMEAFRAFITSG